MNDNYFSNICETISKIILKAFHKAIVSAFALQVEFKATNEEI